MYDSITLVSNKWDLLWFPLYVNFGVICLYVLLETFCFLVLSSSNVTKGLRYDEDDNKKTKEGELSQ